MGLDSCTLIATKDNIPVEVRVFDSEHVNIARQELNKLLNIASEFDLSKFSTNRMVYEMDETLIDRIVKKDDLMLDEDVMDRMSGLFSEFRRGLSYDELAKQHPLNPNKSKMMEGMRFFIIFEG